MSVTPKGQPCRMYSQISRTVWIGGPESQLPFAVESFLGWSFAIACLAVSGYHFVIQTKLVPFLTIVAQLTSTVLPYHNKNVKSSGTSSFPCWLPITTCSRRELDSKTCQQRYQQMVSFLEYKIGSLTTVERLSDKEIIAKFRSSEILRRLASLAMRPSDADVTAHPCASTVLGQRLVRLWHHLLALPNEKEHMYPYSISVIMPAYREDGHHILRKIKRLYETCAKPHTIQIVFIDAGDCKSIDKLHSLKDDCPNWGNFSNKTFDAGGGRGPCLNFGASQASGRILTFCHSDTVLPVRWDEAILKGTQPSRDGASIPNSCAFSFGIDTSVEGLQGGMYPPGIKAVETTANMRTHMYSLPYGDQCLSVPSYVFQHVGGFPDQCLMEDYELIRLLRLRVALSRKFGLAREQLTILDGPPAFCSPRRWQKFGVLFVTWTNSKCVNLYTKGMTPDDLFRVYYGRPLPQQHGGCMAWEMELDRALS